MNAVIIEDEQTAADALEELVGEVSGDFQIVARLQSVEDCVDWFQTHPMPDVAFMDIHLADGSSFRLFEQVEVSCFIIFTTAYDQYALKAFEVNSVDYLLKPVDHAHLERALNRLKKRINRQETAQDNAELVKRLLEQMRTPVYKRALLVAQKDKLIPLPVNQIAYIYTENKVVRAVGFDAAVMVLDCTLDEIVTQLDPHWFYRANRQYIISREAFQYAALWFNGRLAVTLTVKTPERIFISRQNAKEFKQWYTE